jgi:hypothetical protein
MRFAWEDELARYEIFVPQILEGGSSDARKMRKIRQ